jgi:hypothetical protein
MRLRKKASWLVCGLSVIVGAATYAQKEAETFTATAATTGAGGAKASAPVTITIDRKTPASEAERLVAAFNSGGAAALRKALVGVAPAGSVRLGGGKPTPARLAIERTTDKGRLLTIVTDQPILFLGAGVPSAKPKQGYDFAVVDLEVDASGNGTGTFAPAAKITVKQGAFVVEDYSAELVRLTDISKSK